MPDSTLTTPPDTRASRQRMEKLAWVLDGAIPIPGTRFRFGVDSIVGLIPGVGDVIGLLLGATILFEAARLGAPRPLMMKMLGNSVADALLGVVPVLGDVMDFAFKSNKRNAKLLIDHLDALESVPQQKKRGSMMLALLTAGAFVGAGAALIWFVWSHLLA